MGLSVAARSMTEQPRRRFPVGHIPSVGSDVVLTGEVAHHLRDVLRLGEGDAIRLFDGYGREVIAVLASVRPNEVLAHVEAEARTHTDVDLELIIGLPKGPAMDALVRMVTEVGVSSIRPVLADRSIARPEKADRWQRIAASAAQQCGRADIPTIHEPATLTRVLQDRGQRPLYLADAGAPGASAIVAPFSVAVGPEGGWTRAERDVFAHANAKPIGLGPWILRTDTAAVSALIAMRALLSPG